MSNEGSHFSRDKLKADLKKKSLRGAVSKVLSNGTTFALSMGSTMILARLLTPVEFGLLAMVTAFTEFARCFRELGLGTATVQRENTTHEEVSALFWINAAVGLAITLLLIGFAPLIGRFYGDERLPAICMALSTSFLFSGLTVQHRALLERQMKFAQLGIINVSSILIGICVAILMARRGAGVWSLVYRDIVYAGLYAAGTWLFCRWKPGLPRRNTGIKSTLKFGVHVSGSEMIRFLSRSLDQMLIGKFSGAAALGLYTRALQFAMMPINQIQMIFWDIGLSPLSTLQNEPERYRRYYATLLSLMTFFYMPLIVFVGIKADDVICLLLGRQWSGAVPLLRVIAIAAFFKPVTESFQLVMISSGKPQKSIVWGVFNCLSMIAAFSVGIKWGPYGIACGLAISTWITLVWSLWYCAKFTPIDGFLVLKTISVPVGASFGAGMVLLALLPRIVAHTTTVTGNIAISFFVIAVSYLLILFCIPKGRLRISQFWSYRLDLL